MATKVIEINTEAPATGKTSAARGEVWVESLEIHARPFVNVDENGNDSQQQAQPNDEEDADAICAWLQANLTQAVLSHLKNKLWRIELPRNPKRVR